MTVERVAIARIIYNFNADFCDSECKMYHEFQCV